MRKLLYGCILVILGIFLAMGYDWARENFVPSPVPPARPKQGNVRYPEIDYLRKNAIRELGEIPAVERQQIRDNVSASMTGLDPWLEKLLQSPPELICVGERHDDVTREFLARHFFPRYPLDALMLEISHGDLAILARLVDSGSSRLSLLEADVAEIIRAARSANSDVAIHGIEETRDQMIARFETRSGSREQSIVENFRARFQRGKRHAVLYGALHCTDGPSWFYGSVIASDNEAPPIKALSVNVVNAHESGETEAFVNFLRALDLPEPPFVVPHTAMLHSEVYAWFPQLSRTFRQYDAVIVF